MKKIITLLFVLVRKPWGIGLIVILINLIIYLFVITKIWSIVMIDLILFISLFAFSATKVIKKEAPINPKTLVDKN